MISWMGVHQVSLRSLGVFQSPWQKIVIYRSLQPRPDAGTHRFPGPIGTGCSCKLKILYWVQWEEIIIAPWEEELALASFMWQDYLPCVHASFLLQKSFFLVKPWTKMGEPETWEIPHTPSPRGGEQCRGWTFSFHQRKTGYQDVICK